ncbi:MAG: Helicase, SNF2/RAD54 family [uncultured Acidimicrobiales bacterium]|uniref:Helicase, SNF2/RAD54 family n=1 Tax=uncultured Acidimicrobiales bacterium TaxID=310071 RepID=A0A6J4J253_9ACTN|nr:MAG: Helicase, SNF2/RAD54 family [uncultured Acidimicrobiales bacterium]
MLTGGVEATFVPSEPPASGVIALWPSPGGEPLRVVMPTAAGARRRTVRARLVPIGDALPHLVGLPVDAEVHASLAAWAVAAKLAVDLVARGRLRPARTPDGGAGWQVGPLDPDDDRRLNALVAALPPSAHALPIPGSAPARVVAPEVAGRGFLDAVADRLVRTAAAAAEGGRAFAVPGGGPLTGAVSAWLETAGATPGDRARPGLRLSLPLGPEGDLEAILQLRSQLDPSLVVDAAQLWEAPAVVLARLGADAEADLLVALRRAGRVWPPAARLLEEARPARLTLSDDEAADLLGPVASDLGAAGLEVLWPTELTSGRIELRAVVSATGGHDGRAATPAPVPVTSGGLSLEALVEMRFEASLDGEQLSRGDLDALVEAKRPLVRLRGRWVVADPALVEQVRQRRARTLSQGEALAAALVGRMEAGDGTSVEVRAEGSVADLVARLRTARDEDAQREVPEPPGLTATLRPYQRRGLAWLVEMTSLGLGGCLADDMGLGKTLQAIALHLHRHATLGAAAGPLLVVCPTTVLGGWQREVERFAPSLPVRRFHGGERSLDDVGADEVVLVTYGVLRRDRLRLAEVAWGVVVADEAQQVKNPLSRTARELRLVPASARVALTGTPVENRLSELWAILDWTTPGLLGPLATFQRRVAVPVERHRDPEATAALARLVRPFLLRRRKLDPGIAPELPAKTEMDEVVPLTAEQASLYEAVVREALTEIAQARGMSRRGLVLKLLTSLKQVCNHPAQLLHQEGPLAGRSGKLEALDDLLPSMLGNGESVLVFTQYVTMGRLLERHLAASDIGTVFLHGGVPIARREHMVARFQAGEVPIFLLSLKAGGLGLNLTRATQVVHYDRWWNPAVEDQASDRAWRIGQDRPVQVHRFVTEGTVEDKVAALLATKRALAEAVVGSGEAWLSELGDDELAALVTLQRTA